MNMDMKVGEEKCVGQELDQEDIAFFLISANLKSNEGEDNSMKAITASVGSISSKSSHILFPLISDLLLILLYSVTGS